MLSVIKKLPTYLQYFDSKVVYQSSLRSHSKKKQQVNIHVAENDFLWPKNSSLIPERYIYDLGAIIFFS